MTLRDCDMGRGERDLGRGGIIVRGSAGPQEKSVFFFKKKKCNQKPQGLTHRSKICSDLHFLKRPLWGTVLAVYWLRLLTSTARGHGFHPWSGNEEPACLVMQPEK